MLVCSIDNTLGYEFINAYNNSSFGETGIIQPSSETIFRNSENTKLSGCYSRVLIDIIYLQSGETAIC